ncbi:MAG: serine hydrolase, partial [Verrucomicrobia bacterium]|nr:serine hydrolase [Verrucomicrobiota bacterium]
MKSWIPMAVTGLLTCLQLIGQNSSFEWRVSEPENQGMSYKKLEQLTANLIQRDTKGFLVIRNDTIVYEWYAPNRGRASKHYTASMAKALVGGVSMAVAMTDGLIYPDDPVSKFVPQWKTDPLKSQITLKHLGSHTSGIQDANFRNESEGNVKQDDFPGWDGDFWRWRSDKHPSNRDAFTLSRDMAPILFTPGTDFHYSNPGIAMLSYAVTASLKGSVHTDVRTLLRERIMKPIGVPEEEWSCGYGKVESLDGLPIVANWGGGSFSANATARVARLMLRQGDWNGQQLLSPDAIEATVSDAKTPKHGGIGWWTNSEGHLGKAPKDAYCGLGAGNQVVLVVPSLNLIMVRNGGSLEPTSGFDAGSAVLRQVLFDPLMGAILDTPELHRKPRLPYPPSQLIEKIEWSPPDSITRKAQGSDNWPITWADDDALYTAYGDGWGFDPIVEKKLSMGFAKVTGGPGPANFKAVNLRSDSIERLGQGPHGAKASGILMVDGVLYLWVRNTENAQLAWSSDHGTSWTWSDWKFTTSFGAPTFLNFGKNYAGARDDYVYVYSQDADTAYDKTDSMVLARVHQNKIRDRSAYRFSLEIQVSEKPVWTPNVDKHRTACVEKWGEEK